MKKWIFLGLITLILITATQMHGLDHYLHEAYLIIVMFFTIQTFVLLRIDAIIPQEWKVHISLFKIIIRFISSAVFILIILYQYEDRFNLVVQFMILYLIYMTFEIGTALTNLRRN
ncbi:MAG: hypothetical protein AAF620_01480 [Bacteroidota bacterium]